MRCFLVGRHSELVSESSNSIMRDVMLKSIQHDGNI